MITREIILESFQTVRNNTIEVARDIPAGDYGFRPAEGHGTVLEMFQNVLRYTEFMVGLALFEGVVDMKAAPREEWFKRLLKTNVDALRTKDEVIQALQASMADIQDRVKKADPGFLHSTFLAPDGITKVRLWVVQCAKEQEMVLRGQLYLTERMLGIVPHPARKAAAAAGQQQQQQQQ